MAELHIWPEDTAIADGYVTASATVEGEGGKRLRLWYRAPEAFQSHFAVSADPFIIALLFSAMRTRADLVAHGTASPSLLANLEEFIATWVHWNPSRYHAIDIIAEREQERPAVAPDAPAIATFSGGVDAAFTVYHHFHKRYGRQTRRIGAGVMAHGFDIALDEEAYFANAHRKGSRMFASLGIPLIPIATNFRDLGDNYNDSHGAGLASCLHMLSSGFSAGLIASGEPYRALIFPWGSNPITDPLFSSSSFRILHDGAAFTRSEKIREISEWPEALENLRVCWKGVEKDRNCGQCEKCIRTILNFRVMGVPLPACFERDVSDEQIRRMRLSTPVMIAFHSEILQAARAAGISASWVGALNDCIRRNRQSNSGWRYKLRQLRNSLAIRNRLRGQSSE